MPVLIIAMNCKNPIKTIEPNNVQHAGVIGVARLCLMSSLDMFSYAIWFLFFEFFEVFIYLQRYT